VLQSIEKTSEYQKWCFDTITPIVEENRALKEDVVRLQEMLQQAQNEWDALQASVDEQRHHLD
jgi:plasmid maintenance system antidote protein VapI